MRELITDEMVEAAARAVDHAYNPDRAPILAAMFRDYARAALEAAAPLIAAAARAETPDATDEDASLRDRLQETIALVVAPYTSGPMDPLDVQITDAVMDALTP